MISGNDGFSIGKSITKVKVFVYRESVTSDTETATRGRPRDDERTLVILETTSKLIKEVGWTDLRVQDIAEEARCGLATIYRRWPTKEDLVAAAMRNRPLPPVDLTGDPVVDLRAVLMAVASELTQMGTSIVDFFAAANESESLRAAVLDSIAGEATPMFARLLGEILGRDDPHIELLVDSLAGSLIWRVGVLAQDRSPEEITDEYLSLIQRLAR